MIVFDPPWKEKFEELKKHGIWFMTVQDVSHLLNISETTVKRLCASGELDAFKVKDRWCIYIDSVLEYTTNNYTLNLKD